MSKIKLPALDLTVEVPRNYHYMDHGYADDLAETVENIALSERPELARVPAKQRQQMIAQLIPEGVTGSVIRFRKRGRSGERLSVHVCYPRSRTEADDRYVRSLVETVALDQLGRIAALSGPWEDQGVPLAEAEGLLAPPQLYAVSGVLCCRKHGFGHADHTPQVSEDRNFRSACSFLFNLYGLSY